MQGMADKKTKGGKAKAVANTDMAKKCTMYNMTIDAANNANSQALPANTRRLRFQARTAAAIIYAFGETAVDGSSPPGPYSTLKSGAVYDVAGLDFSGRTLWIAGGQNVVVEIETYTQN